MAKRLLVASLLLVIISIFPSKAHSEEAATFSSNLSSGTPTGNIEITYENSTMEVEPSGIYHLLMNNPGSSRLKGVFYLDSVPEQLYIQINHRTGSIQTISYNNTYSIDVNGSKCDQMEIYFDLYTIMGYDIKKNCQRGRNEFVINLENTAKTDLWVRQVDISPVVSFVEHIKEKTNKESFYLFIPLYLAYFFLTAITMSYLLFVVMWRNNFGPQAATILALLICGLGFAILPFLIFGLFLFPVIYMGFHLSPLITVGISLVGLIVGLVWIMQMHK